MAEYETINVKPETKEEFDRQRQLPQGTVSQDDFLTFLLEQNRKKK